MRVVKKITLLLANYHKRLIPACNPWPVLQEDAGPVMEREEFCLVAWRTLLADIITSLLFLPDTPAVPGTPNSPKG